MRAVPRSRYLLFFSLAAAGLLVDLVTKHWIFARLGMPGTEPPEWIIPGYFGWETSLNEGALFGMGQGMVTQFAVLSAVALLGILGWLCFGGAARSLLLIIALGCITAGILGNLYDRLGWHGLVWQMHPDPAKIGQRVYAVRDWILIQAGDRLKWPNFNIADSLLVCGAALLMWHAFFEGDESKQAQGKSEHGAEDDAADSEGVSTQPS